MSTVRAVVEVKPSDLNEFLGEDVRDGEWLDVYWDNIGGCWKFSIEQEAKDSR